MLIDQAYYTFNELSSKVTDVVTNDDDTINEATTNSNTREKFKTELLDIEKFIQVNSLKEITNPVFFNGPTPTEDGLLSNEIFGITKAERAGIYAYIDLGGDFIHPIYYKTLLKLNGKIADIVNGTGYFKVNDKGELEPSEDGGTGLIWLKKNFSKIKFKKNDSAAKNKRIDFIEKEKNKMWISKYIVIPPYYRDVESRDAGMGVGEINKLYSSLLMSTRSLKETSDFGLTLSDVNRARIQNTLVQIFDWFGNGTTIDGKETPQNLPGKFGLIKHGLLYKTVDYSARLVLSAPDISGETLDDIMVDMSHAALPLAAAICCFKPFIMFWLRRFFENEFAGRMEYPILVNKGGGEEIYVPIQDYQIAFSDIRLDEEIENFIHGYSNRFKPIEVPIDMEALAKDTKHKDIKLQSTNKNYDIKNDNLYLMLTYKRLSNKKEMDETGADLIVHKAESRPLTWCDLFYMAACEVTKDKCVLITRFPIDSFLNQYPSKVRIKSTVKTIPTEIQLGNQEPVFYKWYPKIELTDIGCNTSPLFEDTLSISNGLIGAIGADYDGDTAIVKPVYTVEANKECEDAINSKIQVLGMNGFSVRDVSKENILALYELTIQPDHDVKFVNPVF